MTAAVLEPPLETTSEWNHSCTSQCPPNCEAAKNALLAPQTDDTQAPTAA